MMGVPNCTHVVTPTLASKAFIPQGRHGVAVTYPEQAIVPIVDSEAVVIVAAKGSQVSTVPGEGERGDRPSVKARQGLTRVMRSMTRKHMVAHRHSIVDHSKGKPSCGQETCN